MKNEMSGVLGRNNNKVILNLIQNLQRKVVSQDKQQRQAWKTLNQVQGDDTNFTGGGPGLRPSGAPLRSGFTLIELLVVVLIIGILAAVALPKYQLAVAKARYMQLISLANALRKGQDLYKMANGEYSNDISVLDIDLPPGTQVVSNKISYPWGFCAIGTTGYAYCESTRDGVRYNDLGSIRQCSVTPGDTEDFGEKICKSFGAIKSYTDVYGRIVYNFQ